jgi:predicted ATP-binding protein involved in virulence
VRNFKKFAEQAIEFHPKFTLLVGENGAGKTSVLDALAVALGIWLVDAPDSTLENSGRPIYPSEIRLEPVQSGDRTLFQEAPDGALVKANGQIEGQTDVTWIRQVRPGRRRTSNIEAKEALRIVHDALRKAKANEQVLLPVIAYYGAGRAWLPHRERTKTIGRPNSPNRRWGAFYDCLNERIRLTDLNAWFQGEAIAAINRGGNFRPGFEVVRGAVLRCVPGADGLWYDGDRKQIVLSIDGFSQPFNNLSAGQRTMLALVADISIKAVTQNNFLVPPNGMADAVDPLQLVLARTPGVVLIDELDVHLHPSWQRRVATDLKDVFPAIQFVCTSHSPQVVGELSSDEIRVLDEPRPGEAPSQSLGLDSNAILEEMMRTPARSDIGGHAIIAVEDALDAGDLNRARDKLRQLKQIQHGDSRDSARLEATINNLEGLANAAD